MDPLLELGLDLFLWTWKRVGCLWALVIFVVTLAVLVFLVVRFVP